MRHVHGSTISYHASEMLLPTVWIIDHKDSFTWNLAELVKKTGLAIPKIIPNSDAEQNGIIHAGEKIILSPGPGVIHDSCHQATFRLLEQLAPTTPLLGVCLGHQILGTHFGASLEQVSPPLHGCKATASHSKSSPLFLGVDSNFDVGLYHSWRISRQSLPECLTITASDNHKHILAIQHKTRPWFGIQFHPESILTAQGLGILANFLRI